MNLTVMKTVECDGEGCHFHGGGICSHCGYRLRCVCGAFIKESGMGVHFDKCRVAAAIREEERQDLEGGWLW